MRDGTVMPWTAWAVHGYTATGAVFAFLAVRGIFAGDFRTAFLWLFAAVAIDATDGTLARLARVHERTPRFSGEKLDDLVDYLTFVFVPALIVWRAHLVPHGWGLAVVAAMLLSSAYGFSSADAKTSDCFFTGFPSYWNVAALYLMIGKLPPAANAAILMALAALVFVRIGYVYPSRTPTLRTLTLTLTTVWGALILAIIVSLPSPPPTLVWLSLTYPAYYAILSVVLHYRRTLTQLRATSLALIGLLALAWSAIVSGQTPRPANVVLVTMDGARWQEVFTGLDESLLRAASPAGTDVSATQAFKEFSGPTPAERRARLMPFLWRTLLVDRGFIAGDRTAGSLVTVTNRHRFSYPGYSEIVTGQAHDDVIKSNDAIRNPFPSVFQFIRRKLQLPPAQVATFASWGVFRAIVESEEGATMVNAGVQPYAELPALSALQREAPTPWDNIRHDAFTFRFAMDYLKRVHPRVLYIAFDETDDWAHDGKYDLVLQALHRSDAYLKELFDALDADPQYRGRTTVIIATDHGRGRTAQDGAWRKHGKDVAGAEEIWMAVVSPDSARRGLWQNHPPLFQNQIAATIAAAFGLDYREQNPQAGAALALK